MYFLDQFHIVYAIDYYILTNAENKLFLLPLENEPHTLFFEFVQKITSYRLSQTIAKHVQDQVVGLGDMVSF